MLATPNQTIVDGLVGGARGSGSGRDKQQKRGHIRALSFVACHALTPSRLVMKMFAAPVKPSKMV